MSSTIQESPSAMALSPRERELGGIIEAYNRVTEQLKHSHERLRDEVFRLREELARKNRQLRRRERLAALGEMAAGVAHEIRNPLGGIRLFASLLERDLADKPESHRLVRKIAKGVNTVEKIVTDILDFGRPSKPVPGLVKLGPLARETIELAGNRIAENGVVVEVDESLVEVELTSDAGRIKRALLNLLLNALDAAAEGQDPKVVIGWRDHRPEHVMLTVSDNGPGVAPELMDRIFNPFFTTKDRGTGLGLAIVHQLAESLGGHVHVTNGESGGAVFSLWLPCQLVVGDSDEPPVAVAVGAEEVH